MMFYGQNCIYMGGGKIHHPLFRAQKMEEFFFAENTKKFNFTDILKQFYQFKMFFCIL